MELNGISLKRSYVILSVCGSQTRKIDSRQVAARPRKNEARTCQVWNCITRAWNAQGWTFARTSLGGMNSERIAPRRNFTQGTCPAFRSWSSFVESTTLAAMTLPWHHCHGFATARLHDPLQYREQQFAIGYVYEMFVVRPKII